MTLSNTARLLATDQQQSTLRHGDTVRAFTPFGFGSYSGVAFNGEWLDQVTGWYSLGNGYRAFSSLLMRFVCPDSWSPFGEGGVNAYAYCQGDPVNARDPTGHVFKFKKFRRTLSQRLRPTDSVTALVPSPSVSTQSLNMATSVASPISASTSATHSGAALTTMATSARPLPPEPTGIKRVTVKTVVEVELFDGATYSQTSRQVRTVGGGTNTFDNDGTLVRSDRNIFTPEKASAYNHIITEKNRIRDVPPPRPPKPADGYAK
jgi:RHS repeat-associated protein